MTLVIWLLGWPLVVLAWQWAHQGAYKEEAAPRINALAWGWYLTVAITLGMMHHA